MSLQIRRGIESQRTGVVFDEGEISWTTDTNKLYVGDGSTAGGVNVIASAAGTGLTFGTDPGSPSTYQKLNFSGSGLGLTTDVVTEGVTYGRVYFTNARAQTAVSSMFTTLGTAPTTGNVTGAISPSQITVSGGTSGMNPYIPFTVTGTGGQGLTAGTYYICTIVDSTHVTLSSTLLLAQAGTAIASFTTGSITGTTYSAGGGGGDVYFTYNPTTQTISANVTLDGVGITSVSQDTSPSLGGNLNIGNFNVTSAGTGAISIAGAITAGTGNITTTSGNIIATAGNITAGGTVSAPTLTASDHVSAVAYQGTALTSAVLFKSSAQQAVNINTLNIDGTGTNAPAFTLNSSRGTIAAPTNTAAGDILTSIQFQGYYGGQYIPAVTVRGQWESGSVLTSPYAGGTFFVGVGNNNNAFNTLTFNSKGTLSVSGPVQVGLFNTGAYPANGPASALTSFVITGIAGQCSCSATTLALGGTITISGTLGGTGTISGYAGGPTTYYIVTTNGSTTFTLSATGNGSGITTTAGTPTGLTLSLSLPQKGMIIFDSTSNHFYGYNGTNWVAFTGP